MSAFAKAAAQTRTTRRRRVTRIVLSIACLLVGCANPPRSAPRRDLERYVSPHGADRNDGSRAHPWRTVKHAAAQVGAGATVHVAPGEYSGPLTIARDGAGDAPIRFVSDRRWGARIIARSDAPITVVEIGGDHVRFEGFDVTGSGADGTTAIDLEGSHDTVAGSYVHDLEVPCRTTGNGGAGIVAGGGGGADYRNHDGVVSGNLVERIGVGPRNGSCRLVHGIYAAVPRVVVVNNIIDQAVGDGITSWHAARALTIVNNLSLMNGGAGILIGSGDNGATSTGNTRTVVSNNIVYGNFLAGIAESSDGDHPVGPGNRYWNNLAFANSPRDPFRDSEGPEVSPSEIISGNFNADPIFAESEPGRRHRYRLRVSSPAVDAGTCAGAPDRDFDGAPRPQGDGVDIGPFERRAAPGRCLP